MTRGRAVADPAFDRFTLLSSSLIKPIIGHAASAGQVEKSSRRIGYKSTERYNEVEHWSEDSRMATLVTDPTVEEQIRAHRAETGADRYDEVWEGTYVMAPLPTNDHQDLVGEFDLILRVVVKAAGLGRVFPGANVSDREIDWLQNYRCPDVVV